MGINLIIMIAALFVGAGSTAWLIVLWFNAVKREVDSHKVEIVRVKNEVKALRLELKETTISRKGL